MVDFIVKGVFYIITSLASLLLTPFMTAINTLFPDLSSAFSHYLSFLNSGLQYIGLLIDVSLIPRAALLFLIDYIAIKYSIYVLKTAFNFGVNIYNKLKP